ncbi:MAG: hypothetical protein H6659_16780 [Ardenticatenaceae bacterium]|nr:hypothetical protein [Ardenticatenaceae bacterium]MCB8988250.1 hypothetical protein [Ardenticatenaceae bacterium]
MIQDIGRITLQDKPEWLKIVLPVKRNWLLLAIFSLALLVWVGMTVWMLIFLVRDVIMPGPRFAFLLSIVVLLWLVLWYFVGRSVARRWQYFAADREILFINKERLIIRRPVSIWGQTEAFDMNHVRPFYFSDKHQCPAFDYGSQKVYLGLSLTQDEAKRLIKTLNTLYFRAYDGDFAE